MLEIRIIIRIPEMGNSRSGCKDFKFLPAVSIPAFAVVSCVDGIEIHRIVLIFQKIPDKDSFNLAFRALRVIEKKDAETPAGRTSLSREQSMLHASLIFHDKFRGTASYQGTAVEVCLYFCIEIPDFVFKNHLPSGKPAVENMDCNSLGSHDCGRDELVIQVGRNKLSYKGIRRAFNQEVAFI